MRALADDTLVAYSVESIPFSETVGAWRARFGTFAILCGVWAVPGLVGGISLGTFAPSNGQAEVSLARAIPWQLCAWITWAGWTALISWLVRALPVRRDAWKGPIATYALMGAVVVTFQVFWILFLDRMFYPEPVGSTLGQHARQAFYQYGDWLLVMYMAVVVAGIGYDYARRYREGLFAAERLRTEMVQAQLLALRSQLNPHFLFNALNSVITLMDRDVPAAQRMVARLGELLRLSLGANEAEVPLSRELNLVQQYLEIERIRFGDRLTFSVDVPRDLLDIVVPNLVLQPLVENAIVHGVGPRPGPGRVAVQAMRMGDTLLLRVIDDGVGLGNASRSGHGIGFGNTRDRLAAIYGGEASVSLKPSEWGGCVAEVRLPLHPTAKALPA